MPINNNVTVAPMGDHSIGCLCAECEEYVVIIAPNLKRKEDVDDMLHTVREFKQEHATC